VQNNGTFSVFVVENGSGGGLFSRIRDVEPGLRTSDEIEIVSGLEPGERVVVFGQTRIEDGSLVKDISVGEDE
jgi:multidrug efflux pump subunit AcrA (membrane-fusion protein)